MTRRLLGMILIVAGLLSTISGVSGLIASSGDSEPVAPSATTGPEPATTSATSPAEPTVTTVRAPTATTIAPVESTPPTTPSPEPTTTPPPPTTTVQSTTTASPTTAVPPTTTTAPAAPSDLVAAFIQVFSAAIADGDIDALLASLHPAVRLNHGDELCRGFIEREILQLVDYELTGGVTGPTSKSLSTGGDPVSVSNIYEAEVRFDFLGQTFDVLSDFAVDDEVTWLAVCS
jgi:hypothetical protein